MTCKIRMRVSSRGRARSEELGVDGFECVHHAFHSVMIQHPLPSSRRTQLSLWLSS